MPPIRLPDGCQLHSFLNEIWKVNVLLLAERLLRKKPGEKKVNVQMSLILGKSLQEGSTGE